MKFVLSGALHASQGNIVAEMDSPEHAKTHRSNFPIRPKARSENIVSEDGAKYRITVLTDGLVRLEWSEDGTFEDLASIFSINRDFPTPKYRIVERGAKGFEIVTERFRLTYDKKRFSPGGLTAQVYKNVSPDLWRYGKTAENLGGTARTLDFVNGRCPLEPGVLSRAGYAVVDDSDSMLLDGKGWVAQRKGGDRIDCYLFAYGRDYKTAIKDLYYLAGKTPLLPRWTLGTWWSRYYAYTTDEYLGLMDRFKEEDVPLSVAVLDMDWHYVHEKWIQEAGSSGWTGYTWNKKLIPEPEKLLRALHDRNLKVTMNDHPADGVYGFEEIYPKMAKLLNHDTSHNDPIEFDITDPKYCNAYYDVLHRGLEEQGVDFWWTDWQQGRDSRLPNVDPLWMLNHFGYLDNTINNKRPLHFSRYAGPGSHRYPLGFSGDHIITWESLAFQPEFTATASNIGYGWWSHDIGGHAQGTRDDEVQTRWVQFGVFSPIMRLHSSQNSFLRKEPWKSSPECEPVQKEFLRLRHRMVPYLYSMNIRASEGEPLCQPIYWQYPHREEAYSELNQYFFGTELLVMPITSQRDPKTHQASVRGWLPPGKFVDIFTEVVYTGDRFVNFHRPITQYPVLAPEGAIIPFDAAEVPDNGCPNLSSYEVSIVVGKDGKFEIYEDDSRNVEIMSSRKIPLTFSQRTGKVRIGPSKKIEGLADTIEWTLRFIACERPDHIRVEIDGVEKEFDHENDVTEVASGFSVRLGSVAVTSSVEVMFSNTPQLNDKAVKSELYSALEEASIPYQLKERIWNEILSSSLPRTEQITRLYGMPLEKPMLDVLLEILMADIGK